MPSDQPFENKSSQLMTVDIIHTLLFFGNLFRVGLKYYNYCKAVSISETG